MSSLTEEQQQLHDKLQSAITNCGNVAGILEEVPEDDLLAVLTHAGKHVQCAEASQDLTPLAHAIGINKQEGIKAILSTANKHGILKEVLTTANIDIKCPNSAKRTTTPLAHAIDCGNQKGIEAILSTANKHGILKEVLTTANIHVEFKNEKGGASETQDLTPLGLAIGLDNQKNSQEGIEAILATANKHGILKEVLTTANIHVELRNEKGGASETQDLTPLAHAICINNQEGIEAILATANEHDILEKVFASIEKDDREKLKTTLHGDMLNKVLQFEAKMAAKKTGGVCGVITALAVGIGCGVAGVQLSTLAIVGIAVAAAVAVGLVAYGITYAVSNKLEDTNVSKQQVLVQERTA